MATIFLGTGTCIDYSVVTGVVREFELDGVVLRDVERDIAAPGWREQLWELCVRLGWHEDDGDGLRAFIDPLRAELGPLLH